MDAADKEFVRLQIGAALQGKIISQEEARGIADEAINDYMQGWEDRVRDLIRSQVNRNAVTGPTPKEIEARQERERIVAEARKRMKESRGEQ